MKLHFTGVSSASRALSSPLSGNITAAVLSVNISATPSGQPHSSSYNIPVHSSHSLFTFPGFTATVPTANVTAASYSGSSSSIPVVNASFAVLSNSQRSVLSSTNVPATTPFNSASDSIQILPSGSVSVVSSSYVVLSLSSTPSSLGSSAVSSSVVAILPGIYVRFGINVPKNQSLNDGSFENQLREGIFSIYQNGSLDSSSRNVSIHVS